MGRNKITKNERTVDPLLLDDKAAARMVGIGRSKLLAECRKGHIDAVRIGRRRLFLVDELRAYVRRLSAEQGGGRLDV